MSMKHPTPLYFFSFVEMFERFGYHGMRALLVLYLATATSAGGFGWSGAEAIALYGTYIGAVYLTPLPGGWIADRYLGRRRAITLGAFILVLGHLAMAGPGLLPWLVAQTSGLPIEEMLHARGLQLGRIGLPEGAPALLAARASELGLGGGMRADDAIAAASMAYHLVTISFYSALALLITGIGLFKPNTAAMVGALYDDADRREAGFTIFYFAINIGAFAAPLLSGWLGETRGWHYGFGCAGIGMAMSLAALMIGWRRCLGDAGRQPQRGAAQITALTPLTGLDKNRLAVLAVLGIFCVLYETCYAQSGALINLHTYQSINREVMGFVIPASWFQSLGSLFLLILLLPFSMLWTWLALRGRNPDIMTKFSVSFLCSALAFAALLLTAGDGAGALPGLVLFYFLLTISEVLMAPASYSIVSRLSPPRYVGMAMGGLYLTWATGGMLAGITGALVIGGKLTGYFIGIAILLVTIAGALWLLRPLLMRLMHNDPEPSRTAEASA